MPSPTERHLEAINPPGLPQETSQVELVRNAFRRRAEQAIDNIISSSTTEELIDALGASSDFGAVARALGNPSALPAAIALDPLSDAVARGAAQREQLIAKAGGLLSADEAGHALGGVSRLTVEQRRQRHQLLAVRLAGDWRYPAVQFANYTTGASGLSEVIGRMAELGPWVTLDFLLAEDAALGGISPLEALSRGGDAADAVRRIIDAQTTDAYG
jgi:hypothetical protein